jgi:HD superfamily phosphohydrolase YqeK
MRKLAFENLDNAVYRILENTLNYLRSRGQEIDNLTVAAYDYYKEHCL